MKKHGNPVFLIIALICVGIAGKLIYDKVSDYIKTRQKYDELRSDVTEDIEIDNRYHKRIDWEKFKGTDVIAWVELDDISYPIVHGENNDIYLHHSYDGQYTFSGSIFMNSHNSRYFKDNNTVIYGHNMRSGDMFGRLAKYMDKDYSSADEFYIYRPDGTKHIYKMYSIAPTVYNSEFYNISFDTAEDYREYQEKIKKESLIDYGMDVNIQRKMVTLSTCASIGSAQGKRTVLVGIEDEVIQVQDPASWWNPSDEDEEAAEENIESESDSSTEDNE